MKESRVVTCFIEHDNKVLLLKRSSNVGSYRQKWAAVSGYIEIGNTPLEQALEELGEELSLQKTDIVLVKEGVPLEVIDEKLKRKWIVHPFRFSVTNVDKVKIDWEHTEYRWIDPSQIRFYETVPKLDATWERVK